MRCWCGYLSGVRCRLFAFGPADATAIQKPHHLLPHSNPDWFTFLVLAHLGSPGKRAVKRVCVCVCVCACPKMVIYISTNPSNQAKCRIPVLMWPISPLLCRTTTYTVSSQPFDSKQPGITTNNMSRFPQIFHILEQKMPFWILLTCYQCSKYKNVKYLSNNVKIRI